MTKRQRRRTEKRRRHQDDRPVRLGRPLATGAGMTVGATLLFSGAAQAATLTVGSTDDTSGASDCAVATNTDCTLRDAIAAANATPASTITFASAISGDTITLGGTELPQITAYSTTIQGPSGGITIDANYTSRVFNVAATDATITGLRIQHGTEEFGGGIYLQAGNLTIENSVVSGNTAGSDGGGIFVHTGNLTVDSSTLSYNYAENFGGGIGGLAGSTHAGTTTVRNSTLSGNGAYLIGGGAYLSYNSAASVENSTIYDNYVVGGGPQDARGGGLYHAGRGVAPGLVVTGSTITDNYAQDNGGGLSGGGAPPTYVFPTLRDTIVSGNTVGTGGVSPDLYMGGHTMDVGFSLIGTVDSNVTINQTGANVFGQDPQLGVLGDNGGATETQKPAATSPVVDAGSAFGLTSDQRGSARPFDAITTNAAGGDASDIGAVELQSSDIAVAMPPTTPTTPTTPAKKKKCKKKHKRSPESAKKKGCKKKKKKG
jgi:hypothetical protein